MWTAFRQRVLQPQLRRAPRRRRAPPPPAAISGPRCGGGRRRGRARLMQPAYRLTAVSDLVITEDREAVRHVILNRPEKRNAFNEELVLAIGAALRAAADDPSVRCVVLRGNGPVFSAGMDVAALARPPPRARAAALVPPRLPGGLEPRRGDDQADRLRRSTASASAARWSSRWPATCGCSPRTRSSACPRRGSAWCRTSAAPPGCRRSSASAARRS